MYSYCRLLYFYCQYVYGFVQQVGKPIKVIAVGISMCS